MITYEGLPVKSGGAHTLNTKDPLRAWNQLLTFLDHCTDSNEPDSTELAIRSDLMWRAEFSGLGSPYRARRIGDFDELVWPLSNDQVPAWLSISTTIADAGGPCVLAHGAFRLVDPDTRVALPGQDPDLYRGQEAAPQRLLGRSQFYARLARRSTINIFLSFPFEEPSTEFQRLVAQLQAHLPFRFSSSHWRHWRPRARSAGFVGKRLDLSSA